MEIVCQKERTAAFKSSRADGARSDRHLRRTEKRMNQNRVETEDSPEESQLLGQLCDSMGIVASFQDIQGGQHTLSNEEKRRVLCALGLPADREGALAAWLADHPKTPPRALVLPAVAVRLPVPDGRPGESWRWRVEPDREYEDIPGLGAQDSLPAPREGTATVEGSEDGPVVRLPALFPGYYTSTLEIRDRSLRQTLVLTPPRAAPFPFKRGWGLSAQLYGLSSARNSGPGDFGEAMLLGRNLSARGMSVLGLSPVHALFPANPAHASPYSPSSRLFWNIAFAPEGAPSRSARTTSRIDYEREGPRRLSLLRKAYERMKAQSIGIGRTVMHVSGIPLDQAFQTFRDRFGAPLELHATYDALYAHFALQGRLGSGAWPAGYQTPATPSVQAFAREHADEVSFYAFAQFLTQNGLLETVRGLYERGVSLYLDLAVGVDPGGAEAWSRPDLFCPGVSIGAPPDPFAPQGQDWGLAPFAPAALAADGFRHFVRLLRSSMAPNGMIRMDHAMQLRRLYWQVHDGGPSLGAYVAYPHRELLGILMLESARARSAVIAEDLGTVPAGFREELRGRGMYTWKVLYFEKEGSAFVDPADYPQKTIATVNTHDLPTARAWWLGQDIRLRRELRLATHEETTDSTAERASDRDSLLECLAQAGIDVDPQDTESLVAALHRLLSRAPSELVLVSLSDLLGETAAHNVPGTADRPENWALLYSSPVESVTDSPQARAILKAMQERSTK